LFFVQFDEFMDRRGERIQKIFGLLAINQTAGGRFQSHKGPCLSLCAKTTFHSTLLRFVK
jgi:hypothetical protein